MELSLVIEKLGSLADVGEPVGEGDACLLWINGIVAYAVCGKVQPDYAIGWNNCFFYVFDRLPPAVLAWRINHDQMSGDMFTAGEIPLAIIRLDFGGGGREEIKEIDWDEFLGGE